MINPPWRYNLAAIAMGSVLMMPVSGVCRSVGLLSQYPRSILDGLGN